MIPDLCGARVYTKGIKQAIETLMEQDAQLATVTKAHMVVPSEIVTFRLAYEGVRKAFLQHVTWMMDSREIIDLGNAFDGRSILTSRVKKWDSIFALRAARQQNAQSITYADLLGLFFWWPTDETVFPIDLRRDVLLLLGFEEPDIVLQNAKKREMSEQTVPEEIHDAVQTLIPFHHPLRMEYMNLRRGFTKWNNQDEYGKMVSKWKQLQARFLAMKTGAIRFDFLDVYAAFMLPPNEWPSRMVRGFLLSGIGWTETIGEGAAYVPPTIENKIGLDLQALKNFLDVQIQNDPLKASVVGEIQSMSIHLEQAAIQAKQQCWRLEAKWTVHEFMTAVYPSASDWNAQLTMNLFAWLQPRRINFAYLSQVVDILDVYALTHRFKQENDLSVLERQIGLVRMGLWVGPNICETEGIAMDLGDPIDLNAIPFNFGAMYARLAREREELDRYCSNLSPDQMILHIVYNKDEHRENNQEGGEQTNKEKDMRKIRYYLDALFGEYLQETQQNQKNPEEVSRSLLEKVLKHYGFWDAESFKNLVAEIKSLRAVQTIGVSETRDMLTRLRRRNQWKDMEELIVQHAYPKTLAMMDAKVGPMSDWSNEKDWQVAARLASNTIELIRTWKWNSKCLSCLWQEARKSLNLLLQSSIASSQVALVQGTLEALTLPEKSPIRPVGKRAKKEVSFDPVVKAFTPTNLTTRIHNGSSSSSSSASSSSSSSSSSASASSSSASSSSSSTTTASSSASSSSSMPTFSTSIQASASGQRLPSVSRIVGTIQGTETFEQWCKPHVDAIESLIQQYWPEKQPTIAILGDAILMYVYGLPDGKLNRFLQDLIPVEEERKTFKNGMRNKLEYDGETLLVDIFERAVFRFASCVNRDFAESELEDWKKQNIRQNEVDIMQAVYVESTWLYAHPEDNVDNQAAELAKSFTFLGTAWFLMANDVRDVRITPIGEYTNNLTEHFELKAIDFIVM